MSKTASHAQNATQYFKIQACGATKWSRMPGFLEYLALPHRVLKVLHFYDIIIVKVKIKEGFLILQLER